MGLVQQEPVYYEHAGGYIDQGGFSLDVLKDGKILIKLPDPITY